MSVRRKFGVISTLLKIVIILITTTGLYASSIISSQSVNNTHYMGTKQLRHMVISIAKDIKTSTGITFEQALCGMLELESNNGKVLMGDAYNYKYYIIKNKKKIFIKSSDVQLIKGTRITVYKSKSYNVRMMYDVTRPKKITDVKYGLFHMGIEEAKQAIISNDNLYNKYKDVIENNTALIMLLLTNVNFNIKVAACSLVSNYEIAKKRRMWNPYIKAISRHNGGWFNYRYVNHVTRIRKRIKNELKNTTKS